MGLNEPYRPSLCRNIDENDENDEETAQLLGFFGDYANWTGMAIFYSDLKQEL